jgi:hypothetical protein
MDKYPHILEKDNNDKRNLHFIKAINDEDGSTNMPYSVPDEWENVRHIVGNLYYCWDYDYLSGQMFVAKWS